MSLNALKYDDPAYKHHLNESIGPGDYMINTPRPCDPCFVSAPGVALGGFGASLCEKELVDINSELLNITRKASHAPTQHYLPSAAPLCKSTDYKECSFLTREDTLISNPKCTNKETTVNRWEWLCRNPQDKAEIPFNWFISNRTIVKDNHRPLIPNPIPQDNALPARQQPQCATHLDEQFNIGEWTKLATPTNPKQMYDTVYTSTCQKIPRL